MVKIAKTKDNDHFYIQAGPGRGTRQIDEDGLKWLADTHQEMPLAGKNVELDIGSYRHLEDHNCLYIHNIEYEKRFEQYFSPSSPDIEEYGPTLLLKLHTLPVKADLTAIRWTLHVKLDEINLAGREVLIENEGVTVGCNPADHSSMVALQFLHDAHWWPQVEPRSTPYSFYYADVEGGLFSLQEAIPTAGLLDDWHGNVFCAGEQAELGLYRRRIQAGRSISAKNAQELYWLARTGQPSEWPGVERRIGQSQDGWQLWRLQIPSDEIASGASLFEYENWLSYRDIRLNYPSWRIQLLNPLSCSIDARVYQVRQGQPFLFVCIPPTSPGGNASLRITALPQQHIKNVPVIRQAIALYHKKTNYLRFPVLSNRQEYQLSLDGDGAMSLFHVHVAPQLTSIPAWLDGFQCCLTMAGKHYDLYALASEPSQSQACALFQTPEHFTLAELGELTWGCSPAELPCSVHYEYQTLQGEICDKDIASSAGALTMLWQNLIWEKVRASPWVKLTVDAGSFGSIVVKFQLQPETLFVLETWWANTEIVTALVWLSQSAQSPSAGIHYSLAPAIQITLKQLCQPDMPASITTALLRLASYKSISGWAYVRLQTLLAAITLADPIMNQ